MSQFQGSATRVRCVDCSYLTDSRCGAKDTKVSPKKRRTCSKYLFKGEYQNRTPAEARYEPHISKKTRQTIKKLLELGVVPVREDGSPVVSPYGGTPMRRKTFPMPRSTATATMLGTQQTDAPATAGGLILPKDDRLIWTPRDDDDEQDSDRG